MDRAKTTPKRRPRMPEAREPVLVGRHLVVHPEVCFGKMTFRGTRIPVEMVLDYVARGYSVEYIRGSWPEVPTAAIAEAVRLAAEALLERHSSHRL